MKKILSCVIATIMLLGSVCVFAADTKTMKITLQIEGVDSNIYYNTIDVPYTTTLTVADLLVYVDNENEEVTITGANAGYVSAVNGIATGKFGGYDGWMYRVNDIEPVVMINQYNLSEGDSVVLFYADPFGVGMQYPVVDDSQIESGILKFTSSDVSYDASWNPVYSINPVASAEVTWSYGDNKTAKYTTNEEGIVVIEESQRQAGYHKVSIEKYHENGISLVLRLNPYYKVGVKGEVSTQLVIEGINSTIFNDTVVISDVVQASVYDVLKYINDNNSNITIAGLDNGYVTGVNTELAGAFGGWDGWLYRVNDLDPSVNIKEYVLNNDDKIVLYYGDPFGEGMQYPVIDTTKLENGIIKLTSDDITYDNNGTPTVATNSVVGAKITWTYIDADNKDAVMTYTTDENGEIKIDANLLTQGTHYISVERVNEEGLPTVLRISNQAVDITWDMEADDNDTTPDTNDIGYGLYIAVIAISLLVILTQKNTKKNYEK